MASEGGGDEIEVVDVVRREEDEAFRGVLGEDKVWVFFYSVLSLNVFNCVSSSVT